MFMEHDEQQFTEQFCQHLINITSLKNSRQCLCCKFLFLFTCIISLVLSRNRSADVLLSMFFDKCNNIWSCSSYLGKLLQIYCWVCFSVHGNIFVWVLWMNFYLFLSHMSAFLFVLIFLWCYWYFSICDVILSQFFTTFLLFIIFIALNDFLFVIIFFHKSLKVFFIHVNILSKSSENFFLSH